jgi:hypothetical protein
MFARIMYRTLMQVKLDLAIETNLPEKEFDFTVAFAVMGTVKIGCFQVGDGAIVLRQGGKLLTAFPPDKGEFANQTHFLRVNGEQTGKFHAGLFAAAENSGVAITSDGPEHLMFKLKDMTPGKVFGLMFDDLHEKNLCKQDIMDYLTRRDWDNDPRGNDDRSLALLVQLKYSEAVAENDKAQAAPSAIVPQEVVGKEQATAEEDNDRQSSEEQTQSVLGPEAESSSAEAPAKTEEDSHQESNSAVPAENQAAEAGAAEEAQDANDSSCSEGDALQTEGSEAAGASAAPAVSEGDKPAVDKAAEDSPETVVCSPQALVDEPQPIANDEGKARFHQARKHDRVTILLACLLLVMTICAVHYRSVAKHFAAENSYLKDKLDGQMRDLLHRCVFDAPDCETSSALPDLQGEDELTKNKVPEEAADSLPANH